MTNLFYELDGIAIYKFAPQQLTKAVHARQGSVLFAHANGVSARTYFPLLQDWANATGQTLFSYDIRGMGLSHRSTSTAYREGLKNIWHKLVDDHAQVFEYLRNAHDRKLENWLHAGHSLGGWIALLGAPQTRVSHFLLWDIPILSAHTSLLWTIACHLHLRQFHPLGKTARRRKTTFRTREHALSSFLKNPFFKNWERRFVHSYIDANFVNDDEQIDLAHDPAWEADIFEAMPRNMTDALRSIPKNFRKNMQVTLMAAKQSDVCNPTWRGYLKLFFPHIQWVILHSGGHMFPFETSKDLIKKIEDFCLA